MFSKNIRIIYLYIVSFISLMIIIGGLISLSSCVARYFFPTNYYAYSYAEPAKVDSAVIDGTSSGDNSSSQDEYYNQQIENDKISALRDVFTSTITVVIASVLYGYHWKLVQKERE